MKRKKEKVYPRPGIDALDMELASIESGFEPDVADHLIHFFYSEMQTGNLFANGIGSKEKTFLRFIEMAFGRYVGGKPLMAAFGFKKSKGRSYEIGKEDRDMAVAAKVELLVREEMRKRGLSKPRKVMERFKDGRGRMVSIVKMDPIYDDVAKEISIGPDSVEKIFSEFEPSVEALPNAHLSLLAEDLIKSP